MPHSLDAESQRIRKICPRFRVLIIGRANAGKTTILQKVCNTAEKPTVRDPEGRKVDLSFLMPSRMRGMRGNEELESVKKFIAKRAKETRLKNQLHVIWYCIPTDNSRLLTAAETTFFDQCGTGKVPVIVLFTKFDHGDIAAFCALQEEGLEWEEAKRQAPDRAKADFEKKQLRRVYKRKYPPQKHVYLRDMDKPESDCGNLVEQTADAIENVTLRALFVSTQPRNLDVCIKYAVTEEIVPMLKTLNLSELRQDDKEYLIRLVLRWFPYNPNHLDKHNVQLQHHNLSSRNENIIESLLSLAGLPPAGHQICRIGLGLAIIAEYSYSLLSQSRIQMSFEIYQTSSVEAVNKAVGELDLDQLVDDLTPQLIKIVQVNSLTRGR